MSTVSSTLAGPEEDSDHDLLDQIADTAPGPQEQLERATEARALQHCMDTLSAEQKSSLALAYYQGLSHSEVAEQMFQAGFVPV